MKVFPQDQGIRELDEEYSTNEYDNSNKPLLSVLPTDRNTHPREHTRPLSTRDKGYSNRWSSRTGNTVSPTNGQTKHYSLDSMDLREVTKLRQEVVDIIVVFHMGYGRVQIPDTTYTTTQRVIQTP